MTPLAWALLCLAVGGFIGVCALGVALLLGRLGVDYVPLSDDDDAL